MIDMTATVSQTFGMRINDVLNGIQPSPRPTESRQQTGLAPDVLQKARNLFFNMCYGNIQGFKVTAESLRLYDDIILWALRQQGRYDQEKGLWIWGTVGSGKTKLLEVIRNFCYEVQRPRCYRSFYRLTEIDGRYPRRYWFAITSMSKVVSEYVRYGYDTLEKYVREPRHCFDDVGREPMSASYYNNTINVFRYIIEQRYMYRVGDFTHVTSNLSPDAIEKVYGDFIADRCYEMFNFVDLSGSSWRQYPSRAPEI